jgi:hypothetical protein
LSLDLEYEEKTKFFETKPIYLGGAYSERKAKTRVIAFIFDKEDFIDELKSLRFTGRASAKREELRIAIVTDKKLIKKYKAQYGSLWFPEGSYSTIVLKRYDGRTFSHDLLNGSPANGFMFWVNKKSIKDVEEMSPDTFRIFEIIRQPIAIFFVDLKSSDKQVQRDSIKLVDEILPEVAPAFFHGVIISYADNNLYNQHRKLMGITHTKIPAISINNHE